MGVSDARFSVMVDPSGLVRVRWAPRIALRDADSEVLAAAIRDVLPGRRVRLMVFLNGMQPLSPEPLIFFGRHTPVSAVALIGPPAFDEALVELYVEVYRPPFAVRYFEHESDARVWLALQPPVGPSPHLR